MGETDPSLADRFSSWLKNHAPDRVLRGPRPILPVTADAPRVLPGTGPVLPSVPSTEKPGSNVDTANDVSSDGAVSRTTSSPDPAPPPQKSEENHGQPTAITAAKPGWLARARAGSKRFVIHTKNAVCHSWINVLLIFVPVGIAVNYAPIQGTAHPTIVFAINAIAIIPLAGLLAHATESVASRMGDTWASLLNVTFGNAVELIIFILALVKNELQIVQASILGSILANLLLILGMAFLLGGLRYREQIYNNTVTQMSTVLLALTVSSLLLPTAFHATFSNNNTADLQTTKISRGTCVVLLIVYVLYLLFQLKSHAYMYESTPQHVIDEESHPGFLADIMNASSSDSSSSSSDSDSDTSYGSHRTARQRIKRAFRHRMRRRSNASSVAAPSSASVMSSPSTVVEEPPFFDDAAVPITRASSSLAVSPVEQAIVDDEHNRGQPRIRDFETEHRDVSFTALSAERRQRKHKKKNLKMLRKSSKAADPEKSTIPSPDRSNVTAPQLLAADRTDAVRQQGEVAENAAAPSNAARRPFIVPRLPSVFKDTVFTTAAPLPGSSTAPGHTPTPAAFSIVKGPRLRHTRSLPDTFAGRGQVPLTAQSVQRPGPDAPALDEEASTAAPADHEQAQLSRTAAVMMLLISTGLVAFCAELLVDAIPEMISNTNVSQAFIGLIILPIVGNAAEHVTAVTMALKNKMDLAIGISVGSSIQIALFITPVVVLLGWILDKELSLYFNLFETVSLFVTIFVVNFLVLDGRSNYLEGSLLIAAYVIIAVAAYFYPSTANESLLGGAAESL